MPTSCTGVVLSGGGALGAYEAGVLAGINEILEQKPDAPPLFDIFAGTSVGAINATFLAANADRGDHGVPQLLEHWRGLRMSRLRFITSDLSGWAKFLYQSINLAPVPPTDDTPDHSEAGSLEALIRELVPFEKLHRNVAAGKVRAAMVAAQHISSGRTHVFVELSPHMHYVPSSDPQRMTSFHALTPEHLLASSAVPFLFPVRQIGGGWYCDGAIKLNTPLVSAVRAGARRLLVITLGMLGLDPAPIDDEKPEPSPDSAGLISSLLASVVVDPVSEDLIALDRMNRLLKRLESRMDAEALMHFHDAVREVRGAPYRHVEALVFQASDELARLGAEHIDEIVRGGQYGWFAEWLLGPKAEAPPAAAAAVLSFLLFDGDFAGRLIELGRQEAHKRADEIKTFFEAPGEC